MNRRGPAVVVGGMSITKRLTPFLGLVALAAAACGGSSSGGTQKVSSQSGGGGSAAVVATKSGSNGMYLVDSKGMTLYLFKKDTSTKSTCSSACASYWPPYTTSGTPTVSGSAQQSMVGTSKRSDGKTQVTYNGHPLYYFAQDSNPGDTNGQGTTFFGGEWNIVAPNGTAIEKKSGGSDDNGGSSRGSYY